MAVISRSSAIKMLNKFQKSVQEDDTDDLEAEDQMDPDNMSNEMLAEQINLHDLGDGDEVEVVDDDEIDEEEAERDDDPTEFQHAEED